MEAYFEDKIKSVSNSTKRNWFGSSKKPSKASWTTTIEKYPEGGGKIVCDV